MRLRIRSLTVAAFVVTSRMAMGQGSAAFANDPLAKALSGSPVAVARTLQDQVSKSALQDLAARAPADRPLKIGVVTTLPSSGKVFGTGQAYTKALHDRLGLGKGVLLIVVERTGHVYAATDALGSGQISSVLSARASTMRDDPVGTIEGMAADLYQRAGTPLVGAPTSPAEVGGTMASQPEESPADGSSQLLLGVLIVGGIIALVVLANRAARKRAAMAEARKPIERLRAEIVTDLSYADAYLDLLPDTPDAQAARASRDKSGELFDQGRRLLHAARTPEDLGRVEAVLQQARDEAGICRQYLDRATGGTGYAVAVDGTDFRATPALAETRPAPLSRDLNVDAIPPGERAACFFCSRPSDIANLTPVTIAMNGQRRKVLACPDDVRSIREGAPPQIRTVTVDGQARPWFAAPGYDPYRDYWAGEPVYAPVYWGPADALWTGFILGTALSAPVPYPVYLDGGGMPTADPGSAFGAAPDISGGDGVGGASFLDPSDSSDFGGAADFGASDVGGSDFGASDFGASDFGGADIGGSDFGGSDFDGGDGF